MRRLVPAWLGLLCSGCAVMPPPEMRVPAGPCAAAPAVLGATVRRPRVSVDVIPIVGRADDVQSTQIVAALASRGFAVRLRDHVSEPASARCVDGDPRACAAAVAASQPEGVDTADLLVVGAEEPSRVRVVAIDLAARARVVSRALTRHASDRIGPPALADAFAQALLDHVEPPSPVTGRERGTLAALDAPPDDRRQYALRSAAIEGEAMIVWRAEGFAVEMSARAVTDDLRAHPRQRLTRLLFADRVPGEPPIVSSTWDTGHGDVRGFRRWRRHQVARSSCPAATPGNRCLPRDDELTALVVRMLARGSARAFACAGAVASVAAGVYELGPDHTERWSYALYDADGAAVARLGYAEAPGP